MGYLSVSALWSVVEQVKPTFYRFAVSAPQYPEAEDKHGESAISQYDLVFAHSIYLLPHLLANDSQCQEHERQAENEQDRVNRYLAVVFDLRVKNVLESFVPSVSVEVGFEPGVAAGRERLVHGCVCGA